MRMLRSVLSPVLIAVALATAATGDAGPAGVAAGATGVGLVIAAALAGSLVPDPQPDP